MRCLAGPVLALLALSSTGCFYDSRWGEREREQRRNAAHAAPAALHAGEPAPAPAGSAASTAITEASGTVGAEPAERSQPVRAFRVRVYATPQYAAQVADWQRQVRDVVGDANRVLAASLGARLDIETVTAWSDPPAEEDLQGALDALLRHDAGGDADWVIGLVGGLPKLTRSFYDVGRSFVLGKHLVLRAPSRLGEHDAIERSFDELAEDERARLRHGLKRHRASAVLLHEIGHTLGALHEVSAKSIMHPEYTTSMASFSADGESLMRIALAHRSREAHHAHDAAPLALPRELLAHLEAASPTPFTAGERDAMLVRLRATLARAAPPAPSVAPAAAATSAPAPASAVSAADLTALSATDRATYGAAASALAAGHAQDGWNEARPLFARYPKVLAVQDLRCQLAMQRQAAWTETRAECDPLMRLSTAKAGR